MSTLFALRALLFAGECLAGSALLFSLAWLASGFAKQASLRHLFWLTAFGTSLVLPLAAAIVPPTLVLERPVETEIAMPVYVEQASASVPKAEVAPARSALPQFDVRDGAIAAFGLWLMGFSWFVFRLALGAYGAHRLRLQSRPHAFSSADLPDFGATRRECELRLAESAAGPMTWGFFRPIVLLPRAARAWPRERLRAVLLHELAHVRRRDSLTQAMSHLVCAIYWMNPLAWIGANALRREAEIAADDAVIVSGMKPSAYAGELLGLASECRGRPAALAGVSMAQSSLEARVKSVLAPNHLRTGVTSMDVLKIAGAGFAAALCMAFARADVADAVPPAPPAPPAVNAAVPPPPPEVPDVPDVDNTDLPPATPEDVSDVAPAAPPAPPAPVIHVRHVHHLSPADRVRIEAEVQRAQDEVARVEPEIRKAVAAAKVDQRVARALANIQPRVDAEIARAMAKAGPQMRKALADAHIAETVHAALAQAQPQIDAAIAEAHRQVVIVRKQRMENGDVRVEREEHEDASDGDDGQDDEQGDTNE